ncbi:hypothetical protein [Halomonas elongata]|uniref:hypothetical protein n=1 Tax=Halomonas elongata TaxID=2746 RepID=UPI004033EADD
MGLNDNGERVYKEGNNIALQVRKGIDEGRLRRALSTLGEKKSELDKQKKWPFFGQSRYAVVEQPSGMAP